MTNPIPAGMMRTKRGVRIAARPASDRNGVVLVVFGVEIRMTGDESHHLRDLLQDAELRAERGDAFDEI